MFFFLTALLLLVACSNDCSESKKEPKDAATVLPFDTVDMATKYKADPYGMHQYVMAFLYRGENREQDSTKAAALQTAHLKNINRMAESGELVLAGPFLDDADLRGIYVFDVETVEEARALTATDPAIQSGHLRMELKPWYGSAGLNALKEFHEQLDAKDIAEE